MNIQGTYASGVAVAVAGMVASEEKANKITRTVESAAGLAFGQPAFRGTGDHGVINGATFTATSVSSAEGTNTGTSTISATPAVAAGTKAGRYIAEARQTSATASFDLIDPDGLIVGDGVVGTAATLGGIGPFTITNASTTIGDRWYIDVTFTADVKYLGLSVLADNVEVQTGGSNTPDIYPQYANAAIMTMGTMWVVVGAAVTAGQPVYWDPATLRFSSDTTKIRIPNARFDTTQATVGGLAKVALRLRDA